LNALDYLVSPSSWLNSFFNMEVC